MQSTCGATEQVLFLQENMYLQRPSRITHLQPALEQSGQPGPSEMPTKLIHHPKIANAFIRDPFISG